MKARRELLVIVGVLVPCLVLLTLALWPSSPLPPPVLEPPPAPPHVVQERTPPPAPPAPPVAVIAVADAGVAAPIPRELAAPLAAVTPEVIRCFSDQRAHLHGAQHLEVRFTPTEDGGFAGVTVQSGQSPYLSACVEDVFQELSYTPSGAETFRPATHTFVFDPSAQ